MQVQAVIFDRDLTLLHAAPAQLPRAQQRIFDVVPGLRLEAVMDAWARWPGPWPRTVAEEPQFWSSFAAVLLREAGLATDSALLAAELTDLYHTFSSPYPDTLPALEALRASGFRLAVLTNFELPSVAPTLANAGIDPGQFEVLASSTALGWMKPDPRTFLAVAAALGLPPEACCFVDDLAENVAGARLVGMRAFQIDRASPGDPAGGVIGSLLDLIGLLPAPPERLGPSPHAQATYDAPP